MRRSKLNKEMDKVKDELLKSVKEVVDKGLPIISDVTGKTLTTLVKSVEGAIRESLTKRLERKSKSRKRTKKEEASKNVDPK